MFDLESLTYLIDHLTSALRPDRVAETCPSDTARAEVQAALRAHAPRTVAEAGLAAQLLGLQAVLMRLCSAVQQPEQSGEALAHLASAAVEVSRELRALGAGEAAPASLPPALRHAAASAAVAASGSRTLGSILAGATGGTTPGVAPAGRGGPASGAAAVAGFPLNPSTIRAAMLSRRSGSALDLRRRPVTDGNTAGETSWTDDQAAMTQGADADPLQEAHRQDTAPQSGMAPPDQS